MGVNKFVYGGTTKFDLTGDDVTQADVLDGKIFHNAAGNQQTGMMPNQGAKVAKLDLNNNFYDIPYGKHNGEGYVYINTQEKTATPSTSSQNITPDSGYVLKKVVVNPVQLSDGMPSFSRSFYSSSMSAGWKTYRITRSSSGWEDSIGLFISIYRTDSDPLSSGYIGHTNNTVLIWVSKGEVSNHTSESNAIEFSGTLNGVLYSFKLYFSITSTVVTLNIWSSASASISGVKGYVHLLPGIS